MFHLAAMISLNAVIKMKEKDICNGFQCFFFILIFIKSYHFFLYIHANDQEGVGGRG